MLDEKIIIIGAGPCGMACALELQKKGENPLLIEKGNVVQTISNFPTHQTFFSSSERLEIGGVPFISENKKPVRNQAMVYYREVAQRNELRVNAFEKLVSIEKDEESFFLSTVKSNGDEGKYRAEKVIMATGYYDQPNYLNIPGESLPKVTHYFKEAHEYFNQKVVVIGGKNSSVDATLELHKAGADVTVIYRGDVYSESIKPWILPEFESLIRNGKVNMIFGACVTEITDTYLTYEKDGQEESIENDFVFAMTGYRPDYSLLKQVGVEINAENGKPVHNEETMETNVKNVYIAGVVAAGYDNNKVFIENGRFHGEQIADSIFS
ncbi:YpdA family putative bacillithiol disulfide reductase [Oceanobacillus jeddahense]|uniref:YpdA family putative bacillithiol disulfide reductase n=1 Tax=Oceanobacillus jeddahense TaxID=1462527 RepID=A0ABY5JLC6_9BACI|nr:YpdA family putative bacillithiol disulfide reductase [Oceanobacillus jeddahense]UUI00946.1 YpdA family putative bacillithiol disulfide reductase [Oceanobacillus jeddahense]